MLRRDLKIDHVLRLLLGVKEKYIATSLTYPYLVFVTMCTTDLGVEVQ